MKNKETNGKFDLTQAAAIMALLEKIGDDGHTIWMAGVLGAFPDGICKRLTATHKSEGAGKSAIYNTKGWPFERIEELTGVYSLDILSAIASDLDCTPSDMPMGRGFAARKLTTAIRERIEARLQ